uniref:Northern shrimp nuclease n=1 Tax=Pandalus borealis TaxID=6703 RepID=C9YSL6_PANBO|nr:northern shrimp nuclease [Pandalus borealis]
MIGRTTFIALFVKVLTIWSFTKGEDCVWDNDVDYPEYPPLILDSSFQLVLPVLEGDQRITSVQSGSELILACPGREISALGSEDAQATCLGGKLVEVDGKEWNIVELGCTKMASETIHRNLGQCGDQDLGIYEVIGFDLPTTGHFYELIRVCFDPANETTIFSENIVHGASIAAKDIDPGRPSFKTSTGFFSVSMISVYSQRNQLELMKNLLGDDELAATIIDPSKQFYFAKGHMAPDADFVTVVEQDATYYYINALPQWQAFNNGNWKYLEYDTRDLAEKHGTDLTVYSGGWGVLELEDINGNPVEIYLGLAQDKKVVPAPALTWKVIYEKDTNRAAAIVGINNPHITTAPEPLCTDICSSLTWLDFDFGDLVHGYTYCCSVADLRAAIPNVPDLGDVDILDE